jgi:hypothetical protein
VYFLLIAVDNGPDRMVYAGPVMSHFEVFVPGPQLKRYSDEEWKSFWSTVTRPAPPDWTRSYLVPVRF